MQNQRILDYRGKSYKYSKGVDSNFTRKIKCERAHSYISTEK